MCFSFNGGASLTRYLIQTNLIASRSGHTFYKPVPSRFRHHQPDGRETQRRHTGKSGERDATAEFVADVAGHHGAQRRPDAGRGTDDALLQIEMTAAEGDV